MDPSVRAPRYDFFKSIVALLLLLLFLILLRTRTGDANSPIPTATPFLPASTTSATPGIPTDPPPSETNTTAAAAVFPSTPTPPPPPASPPSTTPDGTATPTAPAANAATATPMPFLIPGETTTTPTTGTPSNTNACDAATSRSRLQVGMNATILRRLNFRSSPGIHNNWLLTNSPGTEVEIVDGPICLPYYAGAYVWWQVRLPDGRVGWSAEASLRGAFYFMEPGP